jgi:hypothetical protein
LNTAPTTLERAFQLAASSRGIADLHQRLRLEGHRNTERDLFGSALKKQLQALMLKSQKQSLLRIGAASRSSV